nr:MAG TPA: hypothetical protein [Caudoviricetes sp.]
MFLHLLQIIDNQIYVNLGRPTFSPTLLLFISLHYQI